MKYLMVVEKIGNNYSAYLPDVPGCVATGKTIQEVRKMMEEALELHIKGLKKDGIAIPVPTSEADFVSANT